MNDSEKKETLKQNERSATLMKTAKDYLGSTSDPSLDEFSETLIALYPDISKKAARGIYKVAYFQLKGKPY